MLLRYQLVGIGMSPICRISLLSLLCIKNNSKLGYLSAIANDGGQSPLDLKQTAFYFRIFSDTARILLISPLLRSISFSFLINQTWTLTLDTKKSFLSCFNLQNTLLYSDLILCSQKVCLIEDKKKLFLSFEKFSNFVIVLIINSLIGMISPK